MSIADQLRTEANASEELNPTDSSIAVMRAAADSHEELVAALERLLAEVVELLLSLDDRAPAHDFLIDQPVIRKTHAALARAKAKEFDK